MTAATAAHRFVRRRRLPCLRKTCRPHRSDRILAQAQKWRFGFPIPVVERTDLGYRVEGATLRNTVHIFAAYAANEVQPKLQVPGIEGAYRAVSVSLVTSPDDPPRERQSVLPERQRTSNTFRLE